MATMLDIVDRALRKIGVVSSDEPMEAEDAADGLDALNGMLHEWSLRGVDTSHVSLELSDTFPLSAAYEDGTVFMLAARISPDYTVPAAFDADDFFRAIQAAYMSISEVTMPNALIYVPSQLENLTGQSD